MSNLNWNQVRADFGDSNQSMSNSIGALSHAGTVFGQLRKSILDEEQRTIDNAYREKDFAEKVRQFGLEHTLREDELSERTRHNLASEDYNDRSLNEQIRAHNLQHEAAMGNVAAQRALLGLRLQEHQLKLNDAANARMSTEMQGLFQATLSTDDSIRKPAMARLQQIQGDTSMPLHYRSDAAALLKGAAEIDKHPEWKLDTMDAQRSRLAVYSGLSGPTGDKARAGLAAIDEKIGTANREAKAKQDAAEIQDSKNFEDSTVKDRLDTESHNMVTDSINVMNATLEKLFPKKNYRVSQSETYKVLKHRVADGLRENWMDGERSFNTSSSIGPTDVSLLPNSPSAHALYQALENGTLLIGNKKLNKNELEQVRESLGITRKTADDYKAAQEAKTKERERRLNAPSVGETNPLGLGWDLTDY